MNAGWDWRAVPLQRLRLPLASLFAVALLAASAMAVGGGLVARADGMAARMPDGARLFLVVRAADAAFAREQASAWPGVQILSERGAGEILAQGGVADVGPEHLAVLDLHVAGDSSDLPAAIDRIRAIPRRVDLIDVNARERRQITPAAVTRLLLGGISLLVLGCAVLLAAVVVTALVVGREHREEIGVRMLLGAEAGGLWGPLGVEVAAAALAGALSGFAATAVLARTASVTAGDPVPLSLGAALLGGASFLCGTLGLALGAARRAVARAARATVLATGLALLVLAGVARASDGFGEVAIPGEPNLAGNALRVLSRDLAVCRRALHVARKGVAGTEHQALVAAARRDPVRLRLAAAERAEEIVALRAWEERCDALASERGRLREALRSLRQMGPEITPRRAPVEGPVALRFGQAGRRRGTAGFRNGVAMRTRAGESVRATAPGRVAYSGEVPGSGGVVVIDHGRRTYSVYAKVGRSLVSVGEQVEAGQTVARARTGLLYFSIRRRGRAVDPLAWVADAAKG